jgi:hypothetical protein
LSDDERLKFVGRIYRHHFAVATKLLAFAEKYPDDPVALDALMLAVWQVNGTPWPVEMVGEDTARAPVFEILERDHCRSDKIGPLCERISYGFGQEYEPFLRAVLATNPNPDVQATACLSLGRLLNSRLQRVDLCREQSELAREFADLLGDDYLAELLRENRAEALNEIESTFTLAVEKFSEAKLPNGQSVAERANAELFAIRNLSVGKQAMEIEGEDQDGIRFRLSDYRGKVVLLDFWSYV